MKIGNFNISKGLITLALSAIVLIFLVSTYSSFNNREVELRTKFDMEIKNRTAFYDKMKRIISGKVEVAKQNDSSFIRVVNAAMDPRKDGQNLMMKWIQESNPTLQFSMVQELYKELSRTIEAERNGFFEREQILASIQREHSMFLQSFPNNFYNTFMGRKELQYTPITSTYTKQVMDSGIDDDNKVF